MSGKAAKDHLDLWIKGKNPNFIVTKAEQKYVPGVKMWFSLMKKNKKVQTDLKQGDESSDKERDPGERERERSK